MSLAPLNYSSALSSASGFWSRIFRPQRRAAAFTLLDQGLVSAGNFLTGLVLARCLPQAAYGAYAVILETMLFLNSLQSAAVVYPLTVHGATGSPDDLRRDTSASLMLTLIFLPLLGGAMALGALAASLTSGNVWLAAMAVSAMLLWQLQETVRRALLASFRGAECLLGDIVSYLGQALIIFSLYQHDALTLPRVFAVIGLSSAFAAMLQLIHVQPVRLHFVQLRHAAAAFWSLGKWAVLSALMASITMLSYVWVLRYKGAQGPAVLAAISVPLKLANPVMLAIGNLLVPAVARAYVGGDHRKAFQAAFWHTLPGSLLLLPYYGFLIFVPGVAMRLLLGARSPYLIYAPLLRLYAICLAISYFEFVLVAYLSGLRESRSNFFAQLVHAAAALCLAVPATLLYGVPGLVTSSIVMAVVSVTAQGVALYRVVKRDKTSSVSVAPIAEELPIDPSRLQQGPSTEAA